MAEAKSTQDPSICHSLQALTAHPTVDPVMFFDRAATTMNLLDTATYRLGAAQKLLDLTACCRVPDADDQALRAVSQAAYLLLSDGYDLLLTVASRKLEPTA